MSFKSLEKNQQRASRLNEVMTDSKDQKKRKEKKHHVLRERDEPTSAGEEGGKKVMFPWTNGVMFSEDVPLFWSFDKVCQYFIKLCFLYVMAKTPYYWHDIFTLKIFILLETRAWKQR